MRKLALILMLSPVLSALPITFIYSSTGSGSIGATSFTNAAFTVTGIGDTANRIEGALSYGLYHDTTTINITGVGQFNITTPISSFTPKTGTFAGFGRDGPGNLFHFTNGAVTGYDMLTSLGPLSGSGQLLGWAATPLVTTSGGDLVFNNASSLAATYQVIVDNSGIPEPSTWALAAMGIVVALRMRRS